MELLLQIFLNEICIVAVRNALASAVVVVVVVIVVAVHVRLRGGQAAHCPMLTLLCLQEPLQ